MMIQVSHICELKSLDVSWISHEHIKIVSSPSTDTGRKFKIIADEKKWIELLFKNF